MCGAGNIIHSLLVLGHTGRALTAGVFKTQETSDFIQGLDQLSGSGRWKKTLRKLLVLTAIRNSVKLENFVMNLVVK